MKLSDLNLLDFGHKFQLAGAVYSGVDRDGEPVNYLVPFPEENLLGGMQLVEMDGESWKALLHQTDMLQTEILQTAKDGVVTKAIIRKSTRQIEQNVSWNVYRRDSYSCRYCGANDVPLSVDHLVTWESGGPSTEENLVSACRKCNKVRGDMDYAAWLKHPHYLRVAERLTMDGRARNEALVATLDKIPRRVHVRSR